MIQKKKKRILIVLEIKRIKNNIKNVNIIINYRLIKDLFKILYLILLIYNIYYIVIDLKFN